MIFTYTSSTRRPLFKCHLELEVGSRAYGILIFFRDMNISGTWSSKTCGKDFVQFGKDTLFITDHTSKKYCGDVGKPSPKSMEEGLHKGLTFGTVPLNDRMYTETKDHEMDVWVEVEAGRSVKSFSLVATPYKKSCSWSDRAWKPCLKHNPNSNCVKSDLFCDGEVNCPYGGWDAADEDPVFCEKQYTKIIQGYAVPKVAIVFIVFILLAMIALILYFLLRNYGMRMCHKTGATGDSDSQQAEGLSRTRNPRSQNPRVNLPPERRSPPEVRRGPSVVSIPETAPMTSLPAHPPSYEEATGGYSDEPPKYADIAHN